MLGVRDLPRCEYQGAECVGSRSAEECTEPALRIQDDIGPAPTADLPGKVLPLDFTEQVCPQDNCDAVVGNVLVFWAHPHMTAAFAGTLASVVGPAVEEALGW